MSTQSQESFIKPVTTSETVLINLGFLHLSTEKKGYATYIRYKRDDTLICFILGPPEWQVEISMFINQRKYELKDLLENSSIASWFANNKFENKNFDIDDEVIYLMRFARFSLNTILRES